MGDRDLVIRPVRRGDLLGVLHVESCLDLAWDGADHREFAARPDCGTAVGLVGGHVAGFACVCLDSRAVVVERLAVGEGQRRRGVGSALLWYVARQWVTRRRPLAQTLVSEYDLPGQLFLRACGFRAVRTIKWDGVDQYLFERDYRDDGTGPQDAPAPDARAGAPDGPGRRRPPGREGA